jgi:hypothetical protein
MQLTTEKFNEIKNSENIHDMIHIKGNIWASAGTVGVSFMKRKKYEYEKIFHLNFFRDYDLLQFNKLIKQIN